MFNLAVLSGDPLVAGTRRREAVLAGQAAVRALRGRVGQPTPRRSQAPAPAVFSVAAGDPVLIGRFDQIDRRLQMIESLLVARDNVCVVVFGSLELGLTSWSQFQTNANSFSRRNRREARAARATPVPDSAGRARSRSPPRSSVVSPNSPCAQRSARQRLPDARTIRDVVDLTLPDAPTVPLVVPAVETAPESRDEAMASTQEGLSRDDNASPAA